MKRTPTLSVLSDADAAATSELSRRRRMTTSVGDALSAYRAGLVTAYATAADETARLELEIEAVEFRIAHPDEPSLLDEMRAAVAGDPRTAVAA